MGILGDAFSDGWDWITGEDKERERAERDAKASEAAGLDVWNQLNAQIPTAEDQQLVWGRDVNPYVTEGAIDPSLMTYQDRGDSAFQGLSSAYDGLGPSAYEGMGPSAYADLGPSAYADLEFDSGRMDEAEDYFGNLTETGRDPIAEADFARRAAAAEQTRRSQTEAALADAEMRGYGGGGAALLGDLSATQAMVGDQYLAGLDAAAMAAQRRDAAAGSLADISERRGRADLDAGVARASGMDARDATRAGGMDQYGLERAGGVDQYGTTVAGGKDEFAGERAGAIDDWSGDAWDDWYETQKYNTDRENESKYDYANRARTQNDRNTELRNDTGFHNRVTAPQTAFGNATTVAAGKTGQYGQINANDQAEVERLRREKAERDQAVHQTATNIYTWGASSGWGDKDDEDKDEDK